MQKVLSFVHKKKKYISKPWSFESACMIEKKYYETDENNKRINVSEILLCGDAVDYLFEGTEATADILKAAVSSKMRMCREMWTWFCDDISGKNEESLQEEQAEEMDV